MTTNDEQQDASSNECLNEKAVIEVAQEWINACARGDVDGAAEFMAVDCLRYGGFTWTATEMDEYLPRWKTFLDAFPDYHLEVINCIAHGKTVVFEMIESGTLTAPYKLPGGRALPPTGKSYKDRVCTCIDINDDGLIGEIRAYIPSNLERLIADAANSAAELE